MDSSGIVRLSKIGVVVEITNKNQETQLKQLCQDGGVSFPPRQKENYRIEGNKKIKIYPVFFTFQFFPKFLRVFSCIFSDIKEIPDDMIYMDFKSFQYNLVER